MLKLILGVIFSLTLSSSVLCRDVCYGDLGCFTDSPPFSLTIQRPIALLPETPEKIAVKFTLYTRRNAVGQLITAANLGTFYNGNLPTKFIIHGFLHNGVKKWVLDIKDAILRVHDANVITVDWSKGNGFPYTQATANTQVVGAEIAKLVKSMVANKNAKVADVHIIGHSLGSHIAGYAGARLPGLGRITGLDPAGPYFENTDPIVRLDPTDAIYVDNIHSDAKSLLKLGLGAMQAMGHADFYPNGGKDQPDCAETSDKILGAIFNLVALDIDGIEESVACSHCASFNFFIDSIDNNVCKYTAYPCNSQADFEAGNCVACTARGCNRMGYWSSPNNDRGIFQLNTQSLAKSSHYCKQNYQVRLISNKVNGITQARGQFTIAIKSNTQISTIETIEDGDVTFKPDSTEIRLLSLNQPISEALEKVYITYRKTSNLLSSWLYDSQWSFRVIEVLSGETQTLYRFCPTTTIMQSGSTYEFTKC